MTIAAGGVYTSHLDMKTPTDTDLGARGATNIVSSTGDAGSYDATTRTLTMPAQTQQVYTAQAGTVTGPQSNLIATALQAEVDTLQTVVNRGRAATNITTLMGSGSLIFVSGSGDTPNSGTIYGSIRAGLNNGAMEVGGLGHGALQLGGTFAGSYATNYGRGSIQLIDLSAGQVAYISQAADTAIGLGACTVSNKQSIVAGDGQESHGDGSITAGGGFFGSGANLTGITPAQVGAVSNTPEAISAAGSALASVVSTQVWDAAQYPLAITGIVVNGTTGTVAGGVASVTIAAGGGTSTSDVQTISWASQRTPYLITSASTVTVLAAWGNLLRLDVAHSPCTITAEASVYGTNYTYDATLELFAGTNTIGWNTTVYTNTTLLDISTTKTTVLNLNKAQRETLVGVRQ
jgi:hypothetical protein